MVSISKLIAFMCAAAVAWAAFSGNGEELAAAASGSVLDAFDLAMTLAATMAFWCGVMRVAKACGIVDAVCRAVRPLLRLLMPDVDADSEAMQAAAMNVTANLLGLGNAATPLGLQAMRRFEQGSISRRTIAVFVLLNTASIQLMPATIISMRLKAGSLTPADCVLPILANSLAALLCGLIMIYALYGPIGGKQCIYPHSCRRC